MVMMMKAKLANDGAALPRHDPAKETMMRAIAGLFLFLAVPAAAQLPAPAAVLTPVPAATGPGLLTLVVTSDVTRPPDTVRLTAGVVTTAATAVAALAANAAQMNAVIAAVKAAGIADRDVQTSGLNVTAQYRYVAEQAPQLTGYQARNMVTVTSAKLADAGRMVDAVVKASANEVQGPEFLLSAPDAALDEARVAAVAKGRARAALYARAAGRRLGCIVSISELAGEAPQPDRKMMQMSVREASADSPIQAGELQLSVQLTILFELEP
jgi:uncharacterized protein YggE